MSIITKTIRSVLASAGYTIHQIGAGSGGKRIYSDCLEALCQGHLELDLFSCPSKREVVFRCPIEQVVSSNSFNHSAEGWHPFSATLVEYLANEDLSGYRGSLLEKFYSSFVPERVGNAVAGWDHVIDSFQDLPAYAILPPWNPSTPEQAVESVESWTSQDNAEHGAPSLTVADGCNYHGPVSDEKGKLEYRRLCNVCESIAHNGYDRSCPVRVNVLRRNEEYRFIAVSGHHRIAAVRALGMKYIPAKLRFNAVIDIREASYWPQVSRGVWPENAAISYFHHLFDFDARRWARDRGLLPRS